MAGSRRPAREIATGSTWIASYKKKKWPVVICDKSTAPPRFMETISEERALPAVLLGRHMYIWVDRNSVKEWDPNHDYLQGLEPFEQRDVQQNDSEEVTMEKQRRTAFRQDVTFLENHQYWHNYMVNQSEARKEDKARRDKGRSSFWHQKSNFKATPQKANGRAPKGMIPKKRSFADEYDSDGDLRKSGMKAKAPRKTKDDDENDCVIVDDPSAPRRPMPAVVYRHKGPSTPDDSPVAKKSLRRNGRRLAVDSDSETNDKSEVMVKATSAHELPSKPNDSKKSSKGTNGRHKISIVESEGEPDFVVKASNRKAAPDPIRGKIFSEGKKHRKTTQQVPTQVKIVFSETDLESQLLIPKSSLADCQFLSIRCNFSSQHNCEIIPLEYDTISLQHKLTFKEVNRLLPYFLTKELGPEFLHPKTHPHPFGPLGKTLKEKHANFLGLAFITASKISHEVLQQYILEKLQALYPLPELSLLGLVLMFNSVPPVESQAQRQLGAWIIKHVAESYFKLHKHHPEVLDQVLSENPEFNSAVVEVLERDAREENAGCQDEAIPAN